MAPEAISNGYGEKTKGVWTICRAAIAHGQGSAVVGADGRGSSPSAMGVREYYPVIFGGFTSLKMSFRAVSTTKSDFMRLLYLMTKNGAKNLTYS